MSEICKYCKKPINVGDWPICADGHSPVRELNAARFDPVLVFKSKDGTYVYPGSNKEKCPKGCIKVELTNIQQVRKFEAEVNESERKRMHNQLELRDRMFQHQKSESRSKLRQQMESFSDRGKQFALAAMKRNDERRNLSQSATKIDPKFRISIFSDNEHLTREADNRGRR